MSVESAPVPEQTRPSDLKRLVVLLLLALMVRAWTVANTTVPSRDCIVFIRDGLQLENPTVEPTRVDFLRKRAEHPPGYPAAIIAMSWIVRPLMGGTTVEAMALSAQLVSLVAGVLLVIPLFLIARRLFDRNVAFVAAAIFTVLPVCVEVTSDGISDSLFLLTAAWALWFGVRSLEVSSRSAFLLGLGAGACCGIGYLIRPDAAIVGIATGMTYLVTLIRRVRSGDWRSPLFAGIALVLGSIAFVGPYVKTIGKLTNKKTGQGLVDTLEGGQPDRSYFTRPESRLPGVSLPIAAWFDPAQDKGQSKPLWATKALFNEYLKAAHYSVPFFGLLGLLSIRRGLCDSRVALLVVTGGLHLTILWLIAWKMDYVSQRHTLLTVMITCVFAGVSLPVIGGWLVRSLKFARNKSAWWMGGLLAVLVILTALPRDVRSLHYERAGHKAAGRWIKDQHKEQIPIVDPFGWAEWYSGRTLDKYPNPNPLPNRELYLIFEPNAKSPHSRLGTYDFAREHHVGQEMVYWYPEGASPDRIQVAVYQFRPAK